MGQDFRDGHPCVRFAPRPPFTDAKRGGLDAFNSPFGGFLFDGWGSKDRRVFGVACEKLVVCSSIVQHRRRRQTVGPPGRRL